MASEATPTAKPTSSENIVAQKVRFSRGVVANLLTDGWCSLV